MKRGDTRCSTIRFWLLGSGEKRTEFVYPDVTTRHKKTPVASLYFPLAMRCVWSKLSHLAGTQHLAGIPGDAHMRCWVAEGSGPIPASLG